MGRIKVVSTYSVYSYKHIDNYNAVNALNIISGLYPRHRSLDTSPISSLLLLYSEFPRQILPEDSLHTALSDHPAYCHLFYFLPPEH